MSDTIGTSSQQQWETRAEHREREMRVEAARQTTAVIAAACQRENFMVGSTWQAVFDLILAKLKG